MMRQTESNTKRYKQSFSDETLIGVGENIERDTLVVLDDVGRLADRSISFVNFLTTCRKFGCILLYIFHDIAASSPR